MHFGINLALATVPKMGYHESGAHFANNPEIVPKTIAEKIEEEEKNIRLE